jgi:hypothetical protein
MGELLMFPNARGDRTASPVELSGPGWSVTVPYAQLGVFLEHLRGVRMGRRLDSIFSRLTVKEIGVVIEAVEARLELGVN